MKDLRQGVGMQGGSGLLAEVGTKGLGAEVKSMDVPPVPQGRIGAPFLALGAEDTLEACPGTHAGWTRSCQGYGTGPVYCSTAAHMRSMSQGQLVFTSIWKMC